MILVAAPPVAVTTTLTAPAAWAGVVAVICVALFTVKLVALTPPKVTLMTPVKFVPVMVTDVPPASVPDEGVMLPIVGAAT